MTLSLWSGWCLDAVGLYQPQIPRQEEKLQELRDSGAGPVHGKSQLLLHALSLPLPHHSRRVNLALVSRASRNLEPLPYPTPTAASKAPALPRGPAPSPGATAHPSTLPLPSHQVEKVHTFLDYIMGGCQISFTVKAREWGAGNRIGPQSYRPYLGFPCALAPSA